MFEYQLELIRELGLGGWLRAYPVNPITMIAGVVLLGIIIIIINAKVRKRRALDAKPTPDAATVVLQKRNTLSKNGWADNVRVDSVNGGKAPWFFHKAVAAIYLAPGENILVVHAEYSCREGGKIKMYNNVNPATISVTVSANKIYALHYHIDSRKYLLTEGDRFEDDVFDRDVAAGTGVWLG